MIDRNRDVMPCYAQLMRVRGVAMRAAVRKQSMNESIRSDLLRQAGEKNMNLSKTLMQLANIAGTPKLCDYRVEQADKTLMHKINQIIKEFQSVDLVYLFGSRLEGNLGPLSDYDFAVLIDRNADGPWIRSDLGSALSRELQTYRVDVILLHEAPIDLAFAVIKKGKILYERDVLTRVDFEARIMGLYFDYLPFLRLAWQDIIGGNEHAHRIRRYRKALGRTQRTLGQIRADQGKSTI